MLWCTYAAADVHSCMFTVARADFCKLMWASSELHIYSESKILSVKSSFAECQRLTVSAALKISELPFFIASWDKEVATRWRIRRCSDSPSTQPSDFPVMNVNLTFILLNNHHYLVTSLSLDVEPHYELWYELKQVSSILMQSRTYDSYRYFSAWCALGHMDRPQLPAIKFNIFFKKYKLQPAHNVWLKQSSFNSEYVGLKLVDPICICHAHILIENLLLVSPNPGSSSL